MASARTSGMARWALGMAFMGERFKDVRDAHAEEVGSMEKSGIWEARPLEVCWLKGLKGSRFPDGWIPTKEDTVK